MALLPHKTTLFLVVYSRVLQAAIRILKYFADSHLADCL